MNIAFVDQRFTKIFDRACKQVARQLVKDFKQSQLLLRKAFKMGKKKMTWAQKTKGLKQKENCPVTGMILHLQEDASGRLMYKGGPYRKGKREFTSVIYIS